MKFSVKHCIFVNNYVINGIFVKFYEIEFLMLYTYTKCQILIYLS